MTRAAMYLLALALLTAPGCGDDATPRGSRLLLVQQSAHGRVETWLLEDGRVGRLWIPSTEQGAAWVGRARWLAEWERVPQ